MENIQPQCHNQSKQNQLADCHDNSCSVAMDSLPPCSGQQYHINVLVLEEGQPVTAGPSNGLLTV